MFDFLRDYFIELLYFWVRIHIFDLSVSFHLTFRIGAGLISIFFIFSYISYNIFHISFLVSKNSVSWEHLFEFGFIWIWFEIVQSRMAWLVFVLKSFPWFKSWSVCFRVFWIFLYHFLRKSLIWNIKDGILTMKFTIWWFSIVEFIY